MNPRSLTVDVLKTAAAQMIFWHHWSSYTPMSERVAEYGPHLVSFLFGYGRMAVAVFIVCAGYVTAQRLVYRPWVQPWQQVTGRWLRLMPLYLLALSVTVLTVALVRGALSDTVLPAPVNGLDQVLAHVFAAQDVLGFNALAVGIWYVAIDLQLFVLAVALVWLSRRSTVHLQAVHLQAWIGLGVLLSAWTFNRIPAFDNWGVYFFAAYGLGMLAALAGPFWRDRVSLVLVSLGVAAALVVQWRERLALAMGVAAVVWVRPFLQPTAGWGVVFFRRMGDAAFAMFLFHYPLLLLASVIWSTFSVQTVPLAAMYSVLVWLLTLVLAMVIHQRVETPIQRWLRSRRVDL